MSVTSGTGGHGPREPREPGEVFVRRPVRSDVRPPECDHLELVSVRVFEELHVHPSTPKQRVVAAGERESAGHEAEVRPDRQLVPARPAQNLGVGAGTGLPSLTTPGGGARLSGPVVRGGVKQEHKGHEAHCEPQQLSRERPQAPRASHRTWKANNKLTLTTS